MTEDEMVGWYHQLDAHEFEQTLGIGDGQGSLVSCPLWGRTESDTTEATQQQQQQASRGWKAIKLESCRVPVNSRIWSF